MTKNRETHGRTVRVGRSTQGDSELKDSTYICILMLNSHCVTPGAVMVKILHDPTNDNFSVFFFYFIGNRLSLWKIKFTFPLTFVLIVSHYSLPHPLALFLFASLGGSPPQSERLEEAIRHTSIAF